MAEGTDKNKIISVENPGNNCEQGYQNFPIIDLPVTVLETIFNLLSFKQIMKLRSVCRVFLEVTSNILKSRFEKLTLKIHHEMIVLRDEMLRLEVRANLSLLLLYNVLKILYLDLNVMKATCWRYMKTNNCFFPEDILQDLEQADYLVRTRQITKDNEPEVTTKLFFKFEHFMNFFDDYIESLEESVFFGTKIIDILNCCSNREYKLILGRMGLGYNIKGYFEIHDISTIDVPPDFSKYKTTIEKRKVLGQYIRNNVRWNNLFNPLKELWDTEDELEKGNVFIPSRTFYEIAHCYEQQTIVDGKIVDTSCHKFQQPFNEKLGIRCEVDLYCSKDQLPFQFQNHEDLDHVTTVVHSLERLDKLKAETSCTRHENSSEVFDKPKFYMEMVIYYHETWRQDRVMRSVINLTVHGDETSITSSTSEYSQGNTEK